MSRVPLTFPMNEETPCELIQQVLSWAQDRSFWNIQKEEQTAVPWPHIYI